MAYFAKSTQESWADVLHVIMASFAMVLLIYVAACSVIISSLAVTSLQDQLNGWWLRSVTGLQQAFFNINCGLPAVWPAGPDRRHGWRELSQKILRYLFAFLASSSVRSSAATPSR